MRSWGTARQEIEAREIAVRTPRTTPRWTRSSDWRSVDHDIAVRSLALDNRESAVSIRELGLAQREATVLEREAELVTLDAGVVLRQAEFVQREEELAGRLEVLERAREIERERKRQCDEQEKKAAVRRRRWRC